MRAVSVKVFMPVLDDKVALLFRKLLGLGEVGHFQSVRFTEFHRGFDIEDRFAAALAHMDVNRAVVIAVEEESEAVLFKDGRHSGRARCGYGVGFGGVVPPAGGAGFFARCGARSMWLALSHAVSLSGLRAYLLRMMASSWVTSAMPALMSRPTAAVLETPSWSSEFIAPSASRMAARSSLRSCTKVAGNS